MKTRAIVLAVLTAASMIVAGTGGAVAQDTQTNTQQLAQEELQKPIEIQQENDSETKYRGYEPTREELDKPVNLETAPDDFEVESVDQAGASPDESSSIIWNPNDSDPAEVETTKTYLGYDQGGYYFKTFALVSLGENVEVWVATNMSWPVDDPRQDPVITEEQAEALAQQFDEKMHPKETEVFGEPIPRNGTDGLLEQIGLVPEDYYVTGNGSDRTVLLVDNVRDTNYYDPSYPLYIAGFHSPTIQTYTDRNVITVDSYAWKEVNETNSLTGYEGTVAHEFQHLIHSDLDSDETTWVNEGMSDYAEVITGYGVPEGHLNAYEELPSNSLINWEDQGAINVLADYGIAFTWTMYMEDQFGQDFISELAKDKENGMASVENALEERRSEQRDFYELYQDFSTAVVTDDIERPPHDTYHFDNLDVDVNTSRDIGTAGLYGANYKEIDTAEKGPIQDVTVSGTDFIGTQWSTDTDPVTDNGSVLYSGSGNLLNRHAIVEVDLSETEDPTLAFDSYQRIEENWDYGFVQVSTDGGETWDSLANENTDATPAPGAHPRVKENVPGLTGDTDGWEHQEFDLTPYAGNEEVLISFRYVTDWAFVKPGWWVKNVSVAGDTVPTDSVEPYMSLREVQDDYIEYQFSFIGVKDHGDFQVKQLDMRTFDDSDEKELEHFLRNGDFEEVIVVSSWAGKSGEDGRVPVGTEFEFAKENGEQNPNTGNGLGGASP